MSPDQVIEIGAALQLLPLKSLFATMAAAVIALYMSAQLRAVVRRFIAWRRALKRAATEGDWIQLRDQAQYELIEISLREVTLRRQDEVKINGSLQIKTYTKFIATEEYAYMELTKVTIDAGGARR